MNQDIRRELISKNLGIKPINHGQIYTFQIALPESRKQSLVLEQRQALEHILLTHQSNLVSLIVRRTDAYDDEDIEYELVYGANWLQVAQELAIEKVWAWVFDMSDEQAIATIAEMEALAGATDTAARAIDGADSHTSEIAALIDQKLQLVSDSIKNSITPILNSIRSDLDAKLNVLNYRIDQLGTTHDGGDQLKAVLEKLDTLQQQFTPPRRASRVIEPVENPINLLEASDATIETALKQVGTQSKQIRAALDAIHAWQQPERQLTWSNLALATQKRSPYKIKDFAEGTYQRLQAVAYIPE